MEEIDRAIINQLQGGLPICEHPYRAAAERLGIEEDALLSRLTALMRTGVLTRVGPLYQIERMGGKFTLAALQAPPQRYDDIAEKVNVLPEVAHNYAREHALNMWFVIATETPQATAQVVARIESETGCAVLAFPKEREYFVELKLEV